MNDEHRLRVDIQVDADTSQAKDKIDQLRNEAQNAIDIPIGGNQRPILPTDASDAIRQQMFTAQGLHPQGLSNFPLPPGVMPPPIPGVPIQSQYNPLQPIIPGINVPMTPLQTMPGSGGGVGSGVPFLGSDEARISNRSDLINAEQQRVMNRLNEIQQAKQDVQNNLNQDIDTDLGLFGKSSFIELPRSTRRKHLRSATRAWDRFSAEYGEELTQLEMQAEQIAAASGMPDISGKPREMAGSIRNPVELPNAFEEVNKEIKKQGGLLETLGRAAQAIHLVTQAHQLMNSYIISPMMTGAQMYAAEINAFDLTSNYGHQKAQVSAMQRQRVLERNLEAEQEGALWGIGGSVIGTAVTAGLLASGVGAPIALLTGSALMAGGSFASSYTRAGASVENIKEQAETEARLKSVEQTLSNIQSSRGAILGGNPFGASGLMSFNPEIQAQFGVKGFDLSTDEGRLWASGITESNLGFFGQLYQRGQSAVNQFIPVWRAQANFRRATGMNPMDLAGYTTGEEVGISEAYRQNTGSYDTGDLRDIVRVARNLGMSQAPQQMFGIGRQLQLFNEQNNLGGYATMAAGVTRDIYGEDRYRNKTLEVMQALLDVNVEMLQVDKNASLSSGEYIAKIPELLFGNASPYGRIDQMGRGVLQGLSSLTRASGGAHTALLAQVYGESDPFLLNERLQGGLWYSPRQGGEMNIEMMMKYLGSMGQDQLGIKGFLNSMIPQIGLPAYHQLSDLFVDGSTKVERRIKRDGKDVVEEITLTAEDFLREFENITKLMREDKEKGLASQKEFEERYKLSFSNTVSSAESFSESMDKLTKTIAETMQKPVMEFTQETAKMTAEITRSAKAQQNFREIMGTMYGQMNFDLYKMGLVDDPTGIGSYLDKYANIGADKRQAILNRSATQNDYLMNIALERAITGNVTDTVRTTYKRLYPGDDNGYTSDDPLTSRFMAVIQTMLEQLGVKLSQQQIQLFITQNKRSFDVKIEEPVYKNQTYPTNIMPGLQPAIKF